MGMMSREAKGVDPKLFDTFAGVANALSTETINACIEDLEGWRGPDIEAFRQALAFVKNGRDPLDWKDGEEV
jgi:hypothetical protein